MKMNAATIANLFMGGSAFAVMVGGGVRWLLTRKDVARKGKADADKTEGEVSLTESQKAEVNEQAETVYSTRRIEIEKWWLEQFQLVQKQLAVEREDQDRKWAKLRKAARVHKVWDDEQVSEALAEGRHPRPAPSLDPDDYTLDDDDER